MELIVNIYSNFFLAFWQGPWDVFDFAIVTISWISMLLNSKGLSVLRLFRAFRVFRQMKRVEEMRIIVLGVTKSLPGVANAFVFLVLIMGIWSMMGVHSYEDEFPVLFGIFSHAMLSCFQMMTFDG